MRMLAATLPTLCLLWLFRTYDTKEQIEKTQTNININILSKGIDLLHNKEGKSDPKGLKKATLGLALLTKLKQDHPTLAEQVNMATRNIDLGGN